MKQFITVKCPKRTPNPGDPLAIDHFVDPLVSNVLLVLTGTAKKGQNDADAASSKMRMTGALAVPNDWKLHSLVPIQLYLGKADFVPEYG